MNFLTHKTKIRNNPFGLTIKMPVSHTELSQVQGLPAVPDTNFLLIQMLGGRGECSCSWIPTAHIQDLEPGLST